ncbi:class I SAM-dependent methyltransferase [Hippea jasoniae]|uniref:class I SAM-dependent methyltransferase n=1 Tax=Hippea jasoniae TaxID=944479 RepID=UPI000551454D|nr:class I SAM-dependent methyltransferase [Hippea jasoniae]
MEKKISKVEIDGFEAHIYDFMMQLLSGFTYNKFMKTVINQLKIKNNENVVDFGCGTAKNLCMIQQLTNRDVVGFDTSKEMIRIAKNRCENKNVRIFYHDIRKLAPFKNYFDVAFISFVLHGFIDSQRDMIIKNASELLKTGGRFCILDYNEFDLNKANPIVKFAFKYGECPLASEFIRIDLKSKLKRFGFVDFKEYYHYLGYVRLLVAYK